MTQYKSISIILTQFWRKNMEKMKDFEDKPKIKKVGSIFTAACMSSA